VQAPAPVEDLGERPAEQEAERAAGAGDRAEDAERLPALGRIGERRGQQRERRGREHRREDALQRTRRHEHPERLCGAAQRGCAREAQKARDERPLAPEEVRDAPAEQEQAAERERVGGDHPLAGVVGEAEVALGGRQRDVHDGHVQHHEQLRDADHAEDQPAAGVVRISGTVGCTLHVVLLGFDRFGVVHHPDDESDDRVVTGRTAPKPYGPRVTEKKWWSWMRDRPLSELALADRGLHVVQDVGRDDPLWPGQLATLIALLLYLALPSQLTVGPGWPLPVSELAVLAALFVATRGGREAR